jgi:DNA-binding FrmR family transcriptional regulator
MRSLRERRNKRAPLRPRGIGCPHGRCTEASEHPEIVKRLRRAEGHLRSVIAMIEAERPCLAIAQQMHAVEKAIGQAKKVLIEDHLDHCLDAVVGPMDPGQRQ